MEIQIPVADQDEGGSREGHVSTSAYTSRSLAHSGVSQALSSVAPEAAADLSMENKDSNLNGPTNTDEADRILQEREEDSQQNVEMSGQKTDVAESEDRADETKSGQNENAKESENTDVNEQNLSPLVEGKTDDNDGENRENSDESGDPNYEQPESDPGTDPGTPKHNSGSELMADVEDFETPRNPQDTEQDQNDPGTDRESRVFITENNHLDEEGSDISGARAETPNWEEEGDENDVASLSDVGGKVSQPYNRSSATSRPRPLTRSTVHEDIAPGQRAVVNTPVSYLTANDFNTEIMRNIESRNTSHAGLETAREAAFQRAMTLMTSRCDSSRVGGEQVPGLYNPSLDTAYGPKCPQYFYVKQSKPRPMPPLKAWRGYHGNVYFEPMQIKQVGDKDGLEGTQVAHRHPPSIASRKSSGSRRGRTTTSASTSRILVPVDSGEEKESVTTSHSPTRSTTRLTFKRGPTSAKSRASSRSVATMSQHHVLYLDKQAIIQPENTTMHEELQVIEKQHSTGSLNVRQQSHFPNQDFRGRGTRTEARRSGTSSAKFDRICRGSVVHKLRRAKSGGPLGNTMSRGNRPLGNEARKRTVGEGLMVIGDKFAPPSVMSPLLRTQTQFSLSSQRMTMNSPDLYGAFERLPPLEQVRISLRHMDAHGDDAYAGRVASPYSTGTSVGVVEDLKPYIKYSPDVRAQYNKQIKYY